MHRVKQQYNSLVGLIDGNFLRFYRTRGLGNKRERDGNKRSRLDKGKF